MPIIWFDSEDESGRENANNVIAYFRKYEPESGSSDKYMTNEELTANYRIFPTKVEIQKKTINGLLQEKVKQDTTINKLE